MVSLSGASSSESSESSPLSVACAFSCLFDLLLVDGKGWSVSFSTPLRAFRLPSVRCRVRADTILRYVSPSMASWTLSNFAWKSCTDRLEGCQSWVDQYISTNNSHSRRGLLHLLLKGIVHYLELVEDQNSEIAPQFWLAAIVARTGARRRSPNLPFLSAMD